MSALELLSVDSADLRALVACQQALACLQLGRIAEAETYSNKAVAEHNGLLQVRMTRLNVEVENRSCSNPRRTVTVMLLLPSPKRLMAGYLLGAYTTSVTLGLVIVFTLQGSGSESTSKHTISPAEDIVVGLLAVVIAFVLATGRDQGFQGRRREKKDAKLKAKEEAGKPTESLPLRMLGKGDPKVTFIVGIVLSFPGVSYLTALDKIHHLNPGTVPTVLLVIGFCLMQQILLEIPLLGYVFAPRTRSPGSKTGWAARVATPR